MHQHSTLKFELSTPNSDLCLSLLQAISFSNLYAPEHLIINVKDAEQWEELVENAGRHFFFLLLW